MTNVTFNHNAGTLYECFNISEKRAEELNHILAQIFKNAGILVDSESDENTEHEMGISNLIETFIELTESDNEVLFLTFVLGSFQKI